MQALGVVEIAVQVIAVTEVRLVAGPERRGAQQDVVHGGGDVLVARRVRMRQANDGDMARPELQNTMNTAEDSQ